MLDGDLASDCRVRAFELAHPDALRRERDRRAGHGLDGRRAGPPGAAAGRQLVRELPRRRAPTSRSTTTPASGRRSIYALHYAGLIPAGPGKSHQSVRDISLLGALPNCAVVQPGNAEETRALVRWAVEEATRERRASGSRSGRRRGGSSCPPGWRLEPGRGTVLHDGDDAVLFAYGPVMLHEALTRGGDAARARARGCAWSTCRGSTASTASGWPRRSAAYADVFVARGSRAGRRARRRAAARAVAPRAARRPSVTVFGVEGWPACGTPPEALRFHGLDGASLAGRIARASPRAHGAVTTERRVWLVLPELLSTRIFFDCGIVDGLHERLGGRLRLVSLLPPDAGGRVGRPARRSRRHVSRRAAALRRSGCARRCCGAPTSGSTGRSATTRSRSGSTCATASTSSGCSAATRTTASISPGAARCRAGTRVERRMLRWHYGPRRWVAEHAARADAARVPARRLLEPADARRSSRSCSPHGGSACRRWATSRAGITRSARA